MKIESRRERTPTTVVTDDVERHVAHDMIRRAVPFAPVWVLLAGLGFGLDGATSAAYAIAIVLANFAASALLLARGARISPTMLMAAALGGYLVRLVLIAIAVLAASGQAWFDPLPLGLTIIAAHLGLLFWETRYVSLSLAYPGLKPDAGRY